MALTPTEFTITGLGVEFDMSHRKVGRLIRDVEPVRKKGRSKYYLISQVAGKLLGVDNEDLDLTTERARLTKAQADKTELQLEIDKSEVLTIIDVERNWTNITQAIRAKLLSMPTTMAVELANLSRPEIKHILEKHIFNILDELSEGKINE